MIISYLSFLPFYQVSFSDFAPYLITTDASLDALNGELPKPISMARFRPNIIISGPKAFEEVYFIFFDSCWQCNTPYLEVRCIGVYTVCIHINFNGVFKILVSH